MKLSVILKTNISESARWSRSSGRRKDQPDPGTGAGICGRRRTGDRYDHDTYDGGGTALVSDRTVRSLYGQPAEKIRPGLDGHSFRAGEDTESAGQSSFPAYGGRKSRCSLRRTEQEGFRLKLRQNTSLSFFRRRLTSCLYTDWMRWERDWMRYVFARNWRGPVKEEEDAAGHRRGYCCSCLLGKGGKKGVPRERGIHSCPE